MSKCMHGFKAKKIAQWIKALIAMSEDFSVIPRTLIAEAFL